MEIALLAFIVGIAKTCSKPTQEHAVEYYEAPPQPQPQPDQLNVPEDNRSRITDTYTGEGTMGVGIQTEVKDTQPSFGIVAPDASRNPFGQPVQDQRDRPYVSNQMNNLAPIAKELVGPGLGVGANVPAIGGFQQQYRVNPTNVGAYKLTTLPGRINPGGNTTGGMPGQVGELTQFPAAKTVFMPARRPEVPGRAQGQGGALTGQTTQAQYLRTKRMTNRAETTTRKDGLEFRPAKSIVPAETLPQDATRNKGDLNSYQYRQAAPGISNFDGGYSIAPANRYLAGGRGAQAEQSFGLRPSDRRGQAARKGNAGRMNVRAGPLNAGGLITAVRSDTSRTDGRNGPANGAWSQNYVQPEYTQLNSFKGQANPRSSNRQMNLPNRVLANNPYVISLP